MNGAAGTAKRKTPAELLLEIHLAEIGLRDFRTEYRFDDVRMWRFDYAILRRRLAIEIEGGVNIFGLRDGNGDRIAGRHLRGRGFQNDLDKYNTATASGWTLFRFSTQDVLTGKARAFLKTWIDRAPR